VNFAAHLSQIAYNHSETHLGSPMKSPIRSQTHCACVPILSSTTHSWDHLLVEQFQEPPGAGQLYHPDEHLICLSLSPRPVRFLQTIGSKTHSSLYGKGDISITPAQMLLFAQWQDEDRYLQIRIASRFIQQVAREALEIERDRIELIPEFRTRDRHLESIGMMLLNELQQENIGGKLYIDSLANVIAVHLIRQYATTQAQIPSYEGGLSQRQLVRILDYIQEHLHQDIRLVDLAELLGISQFHFSHLFKQSIGITPYQYLLQQRIERAKQLLKHSDHPIMEIAFLCGFNSHSHLSQQFRHLTGMTPKAFRAN